MKPQDAMIRDIESEVRFTRSMIGRDKLDDRVMEAMRKVPREEFVPAHFRDLAHANGPVSIGYNQTISQPFIVALMTDLLRLELHHIVLEVGTGSGYQAAVLSLLVEKVYSIEIISELGDGAAERLSKLRYTNIETRIGDGYEGWPEHAPYDAIMVTAAAPSVPEALFEQLKPGGRMAIPVGLPYMHQELLLLRKDEAGEPHTQSILGVAFVPMVKAVTGSESAGQK